MQHLYFAAPPAVSEPEQDAERERLLAKVQNLEIALTTRQRIGMAIGIVMATYKITDEAAFDLLVVASQNTHRKLREVAEEVVQTGDLVWGPRITDRPRRSGRNGRSSPQTAQPAT